MMEFALSRNRGEKIKKEVFECKNQGNAFKFPEDKTIGNHGRISE